MTPQQKAVIARMARGERLTASYAMGHGTNYWVGMTKLRAVTVESLLAQKEIEPVSLVQTAIGCHTQTYARRDPADPRPNNRPKMARLHDVRAAAKAEREDRELPRRS